MTKLDPTGSSLVYSTLLGVASMDRATGIAVNAVGDAFITGSTTSTDFPTTPGAYQRSAPGISERPERLLSVGRVRH